MLLYTMIYEMGKERRSRPQTEPHLIPPYPVRLPPSPYERISDDFYNLFLEITAMEQEKERRKRQELRAIRKMEERKGRRERLRQKCDKFLNSLMLRSSSSTNSPSNSL